MKENEKGPKYYLNIEDKMHSWNDNTVSTEQIIELGGWDQSIGAIVIDLKTNEERTLAPGEIIEVKPGMGFGKKVSFKRG